MRKDDVTEFLEIDPEEFHLVKRGATGFPVLLAKAAEALAHARGKASNRATKGEPTVSKFAKRLRKEAVRSLSVAGAGSTSAGRLSDEQAARLLAEAKGQGNRPFGAKNQGAYGTTVILKAMNRRVAKAHKKLAKAASDFERTAAKAEFEAAARQRLLAKFVAQARRQQATGTGTRFGPASTDLFGGTSLTLPDDAQLHGLSTGRPS